VSGVVVDHARYDVDAEIVRAAEIDILTGGRSRLGGLYLEGPPFDWPIEVLHRYRSADGVEEFRLVRRFARSAGAHAV
jgi:hypothetical protein